MPAIHTKTFLDFTRKISVLHSVFNMSMYLVTYWPHIFFPPLMTNILFNLGHGVAWGTRVNRTVHCTKGKHIYMPVVLQRLWLLLFRCFHASFFWHSKQWFIITCLTTPKNRMHYFISYSYLYINGLADDILLPLQYSFQTKFI
jgi:hypothetical protein